MTTAAALSTVVATLTLGDGVGLEPSRLYCGVHRPVPITVRVADAEAGGVALVVLEADGTVRDGPVTVSPGLVDLAERLPGIWALRRAAYLQLLVGGEPAGSALVLQPMLSRLVPIAEEATNPNGIRYTRIVGWRSELEPPATPPADDGTGTAPAPEPRRLMTGLRIYPDRDVVLQTSHGAIRLAMSPDAAPNTVWNFLELCGGGFYEGVVFHRVVPLTRAGHPFVIQAGDPTATGEGGPGYWLPIEPSTLPHDFGVISMARDVAPDSAGSQFFICLSRQGTARLDGHYCAFGYAVEGTETIRAIAAVELADPAAGRPVAPPVIERAELVAAPPRRPGEGRPDTPLVEAEPPPPEPQPDRVPR